MKTDIKPYLGEYLGNEIEVVHHSNRNNEGKSGIVFHESRRMFTIVGKSQIKIPKQTGIFRIKQDSSTFLIEGDAILMRPEDRLKNQRKILKTLSRGCNY